MLIRDSVDNRRSGLLMKNGKNLLPFPFLIENLSDLTHSSRIISSFLFLQYGFVHCALADLVISKFGEDAWQSIV